MYTSSPLGMKLGPNISKTEISWNTFDVYMYVFTHIISIHKKACKTKYFVCGRQGYLGHPYKQFKTAGEY